MKKLTVQLSTRSYPIYIGADIAALGAALAAQPFTRRALVVTNTTVKKLYAGRLVAGLKKAGFETTLVAMKDGEQHKTLDTVKDLYVACLKARLDRRSPLIALGGGVVGDVAGFVASSYLRGVPFIQVPTTLLAMVDSSVGGKTGFDLAEGKNLVGAFYQPKMVWIDTATLKTLPERQIRNGLAEVIKYGVIADNIFFSWLEKVIRPGTKISAAEYEKIVLRCCAIKAGVVSKDEFEEKGLREILNFGHTFGHAVETLTGYRTYNHGEAVALGMVMAGTLAKRAGMFSANDFARMARLIAAAGLPVCLDKKLSPSAVLNLMMRDKKVRNGALRLVLPRKIGSVIVRADINKDLVQEVIS